LDRAALHTLIRAFLVEDVGRGDLTSESIFEKDQMGRARLVAREPFVAAGCEAVAAEVFWVQNPTIVLEGLVADGSRVAAGDILCTISGPVIDLLKAERVALNLLQRLCGIATFTARFVEQVRPCPVRITDTRKTTPGLRMLEKYAVQVGGGYNHRFNLADGILVKDNHTVALLRRKIPHTLRIEVETDTLEQVRECVACGVDIILLDNMAPAMLEEAVRIIDHRALAEASGGITLDSVLDAARSGVDIVSIGALTHSAPACDIGMDWIA